MTTVHSRPSWLLHIQAPEGSPEDWFLTTFQGDPWIDPDPAAYRLAGDGFRHSWRFAGDALPPSDREPSLVTFVLSCASAADVPPIVEGSVLDVFLMRPFQTLGRGLDGSLIIGDGDDTLTVTYWVNNSFRVTGLFGKWDTGIQRWMLTVECSDFLVDLGGSVDLGSEDFEDIIKTRNYDVLNDGIGTYYGETYAQATCRYLVSTKTPLSFISRWHPANGGIAPDAPEPEPRINRPGEVMTVAEIVSAACASTVNPRHGRYLLVPVGPYVESVPFDPYDDVTEDNPTGIAVPDLTITWIADLFQAWNGGAFLGEWNPLTTIDEPPFELVLNVAGDIASVRDTSVFIQTNADAMVLSAAKVRISPDWRRDKVNSVNKVTLGAYDEATAAVAPVNIDNTQGQSQDGINARDLPSLAYAKTTAAHDGIVDAVGAFPRMLRRLYTSASGEGSPWSPDRIEVMTNLMTDNEMDWYSNRFNPVENQQQTILILDIQDPANPVDAPVWSTMVGCTISIQKIADEARLIVEPTIRPFLPKIESPAAATLNQIAATFPTKTINDFDPELTLSQLALSHI